MSRRAVALLEMNPDFVERHKLDGRNVEGEMLNRMIWLGATYIDSAIYGDYFVMMGWRVWPNRPQPGPAQ